MKYLFIHQNAPGQWRHVASLLAKDPANEVVIMGTHKRHHIAGAKYALYSLDKPENTSKHPYVSSFEGAIYYGQAALKCLTKLRNNGFKPDLICCHPGWGEGLFLKDVYPDVPYLAYTEFFYRSEGADVGFIPGSSSLESAAGVRCKNARLLVALEQADYCVTPTQWQYSVHPQFIKDKTAVLHEGVRTSVCIPRDDVTITLQDGRQLKKGDEIITYIGRNLEPYRGFPSFMRALPEILAARPNAHVVIIGGDGVSYGNPPPEGGSWKDKLLNETPLDLSRVHFLGTVPYNIFLAVLQASSAHIYLTYPFVLSWSLLEAMSCECLILGSSTKPVMEAIQDDHNGILVDFFDPKDIAARAIEALANPEKFNHLRKNARETILKRYDMDEICLPEWMEFLDDLIHQRTPRILQKQNIREGLHLFETRKRA